MNIKRWIMLLILLAGLGLVTLVSMRNGWSIPETTRSKLQAQALPGRLSAAHASLEGNCASCHTAVKGIDDTKCIGCHATNTALLQRQPTSFHATIGHCLSCHTEHRGTGANLRVMNHEALARIGQHLTESKDKNGKASPDLPGSHPLTSALEARLDCVACHSTKDKHNSLFGSDCASCHATTQWTIPAFKHPTVRSTQCAQCHQAPPSHYMEHFRMVSQTTAKQEKALVTECYKCHQTTSFNDIKGIGYYKHH